MALFYDLATEKDFKIPTQPERRERALRDLIKKRQKPIALFIDDAHDLHSKTLIGLKRLIEVVRDSGGRFRWCSQAIQPEERFAPTLDGRDRFPRHDIRIGEFGEREEEVSQVAVGTIGCTENKIESVITDDALATLSEKLTTPLQFEYYLTRALEEAYKVGQKPMGADMIENVLAKDIDGLEPRLTRQGYNAKFWRTFSTRNRGDQIVPERPT